MRTNAGSSWSVSRPNSNTGGSTFSRLAWLMMDPSCLHFPSKDADTLAVSLRLVVSTLAVEALHLVGVLFREDSWLVREWRFTLVPVISESVHVAAEALAHSASVCVQESMVSTASPSLVVPQSERVAPTGPRNSVIMLSTATILLIPCSIFVKQGLLQTKSNSVSSGPRNANEGLTN